MGTGAEFVGPLLAEELAVGFAAEMAAGGIFASGAAAAAGEFAGPLTSSELGGGFQSYMADLGIAGSELASGFSPEILSQAADGEISPDAYLGELENFGGINTLEGYNLNPLNDVPGTEYGSVNEFGTNAIDPSPMAQENVFNPTQSLDSSPQVGMDGLDAGSYGYGPAEATGSNPLSKLKDIMKTPQYQLAKTGIDLYSMASDNSANQAGLRRFNELADRNKWAGDTAQNLYTNPDAFFNSPAFKQSQAGAMNKYKAAQAASGRRSDTAGLAMKMQQYGMDQFNNYSQGLSRYNTQPNTSGLQGLYQGAGKGRSNMLNTLANKDLSEAVG